MSAFTVQIKSTTIPIKKSKLKISIGMPESFTPLKIYFDIILISQRFRKIFGITK
jgi:hypothetical protein